MERVIKTKIDGRSPILVEGKKISCQANPAVCGFYFGLKMLPDEPGQCQACSLVTTDKTVAKVAAGIALSVTGRPKCYRVQQGIEVETGDIEIVLTST